MLPNLFYFPLLSHRFITNPKSRQLHLYNSFPLTAHICSKYEPAIYFFYIISVKWGIVLYITYLYIFVYKLVASSDISISFHSIHIYETSNKTTMEIFPQILPDPY